MKRITRIGLSIGAITAAAVGIFYFSQPSVTSIRPSLVGYSHNSRDYLLKQAQPTLTCPAAASSCWHWNMEEASGNIVDDLQGAVGIPRNAAWPAMYRVHTPIPKADGFTKYAIAQEHTQEHFVVSGDTSVGDQTTNDFSVSAWIYLGDPTGAYRYVASKRVGNTGLDGWQINVNTLGTLRTWVGDGATTVGGVVDSVSLTPHTWNHVVWRFDHGATTSAVVNGVDTGVTTNIAAVGSIATAQPLRIGGDDINLESWFGSIAEVLVTTGGMHTVAEAQAEYRAFKVPTDVTFAQTTSRKWYHPPIAGFGERISSYPPNQWPTSYSAELVGVDANVLGLGFPAYPAVTNIIGYPNELNLWSPVNGATLIANKYEGPDGGQIADELNTVNVNGLIYKYTTLGVGGLIGAGNKFCASFYVKKISGDCTHVALASSDVSVVQTATVLTADWARVKTCSTAAAAANPKRILICGSDGALACNAICVMALSDTQYEPDNVTPPCTHCEGNVNCTCAANSYTQTFASNQQLMPHDFDRMEVDVDTAVTPLQGTADMRRPVVKLGQYAEIIEGLIPSFTIKSQGNEPIGVVRGKPLQWLEERRHYAAGWDLVDGVTNAGDDNWGWKFNYLNHQNVRTADATKAVIGTTEDITVEAIIQIDEPFNAILTTKPSGGTTGYQWALTNVGTLDFTAFGHDGNSLSLTSGAAAFAIGDGKPHYIAAHLHHAGAGVWTGFELVDGESVGAIMWDNYDGTSFPVNGHGLVIGDYVTNNASFDGVIYNVHMTTYPYTQADLVARYSALITSGNMIQNDSGTMFNYHFQEQTTANGLIDSSPNKVDLTTVSASSPIARFQSTEWGARERVRLMINEERQAVVLNPPRNNSATGLTFSPPDKDDPNSYTMRVGTDGTDYFSGVIASAYLYPRSEPKPFKKDPKHLLTVDQTTAGFLDQASIPPIRCADGVATADCLVWNMNDWGGKLYDDINDTPLNPFGAVVYGAPSGLLTKGQGRRGVYLLGNGTWDRTEAATTGLVEIGTATQFSVEALFSNGGDISLTAGNIVGSSSHSGAEGYSLVASSAMRFGCYLSAGGNMRTCPTVAADTIKYDVPTYGVCVWTRTGANWNDPVAYINSEPVALNCYSGVATGDVSNGQTFRIGGSTGIHYFRGTVYEAQVSTKELSAAEVKANYLRYTRTGKPLDTYTESIGHYVLNEETVVNGIGVKDRSSAGSDLTVVPIVGHPTPNANMAVAPLGGPIKPSVTFDGTTTYFAATGNTIADVTTEDFSVSMWIRFNDVTNPQRLFSKSTAAGLGYAGYVWLGRLGFTLGDAGFVTQSDALGNVSVGVWYYITYAFDRSGNLRVYTNKDVSRTFAITTSPGTVTSATPFTLGRNSAAASQYLNGSMAGATFSRHLTTEAEHLQNYRLGHASTGDNLLYRRSNTGCYETSDNLEHGLGVTCFQANEVPYARSTTLCDIPGNRACLGQPDHDAVENLIGYYSEDFSTWLIYGTSSIIVDDAVAPDGSHTADRHTAGNWSDGIGSDQITTAIGVDYTFSVYARCYACQSSAIGGHNIYIRLVRIPAGTTVATSGVVMLTPQWQKIVVSGTADTVLTRCDINLQNLGRSSYIWGAQFIQSNTPAVVYKPTYGAPATANAVTRSFLPSYVLANWDREEGLGSILYETNTLTSTYPMDMKGTGNNSRTSITDSRYCTMYNSAGVLQQSIDNGTTPSAGLKGVVFTYDSQSTIKGTRRAWCSMYGDDYAGEFLTYSTDTAANWTAVNDTHASTGLQYGATSGFIDGYMCGMSIWKDR